MSDSSFKPNLSSIPGGIISDVRESRKNSPLPLNDNYTPKPPCDYVAFKITAGFVECVPIASAWMFDIAVQVYNFRNERNGFFQSSKTLINRYFPEVVGDEKQEKAKINRIRKNLTQYTKGASNKHKSRRDQTRLPIFVSSHRGRGAGRGSSRHRFPSPELLELLETKSKHELYLYEIVRIELMRRDGVIYGDDTNGKPIKFNASKAAYVLLSYMFHYTRSEDEREFYIHYQQIKRETTLTRNTVDRTLAALESANLIEPGKTGGYMVRIE